MKTLLFLPIILVVIASCSVWDYDNNNSVWVQNNTSGSMNKETYIIQNEISDMDKKETDNTITKSKSEWELTSWYIDYDDITVKNALASGQQVALFFHAPWCPTCRSMDKSLASSSIPSNTLVVKVDYDTSDSLKRQYGITSQSTTVVLNSDGTARSKRIGGMTIDEIFK